MANISSKKATLAIYTPTYFPHYVGGGERLVQMIAAGLQKLGVEVVILSEGVELGEYEFDGIRVLTLPHRTDLAYGPYSSPDPDVLRCVLQDLEIRAVHTVTVHSLPQLASAVEELKLSLGMTAMDHGLVCDRRTLIRSDGALCEGCRPLEECFSCNLKDRRLRDRLIARLGRHMPNSSGHIISERMSRLAGRPLGRQLTWWQDEVTANTRLSRAIDRLDVFLTPTRWNMELSRSRLAADTASEVIMFPLPREFQRPEPKKSPFDLLRVGFIGRPIAIKGLSVLIAAVESAHLKIPLELHMFCPRNNDQEAEYWLPLRDRVNKLGGSIWHECGVLDGEALRKIHGTIDVIALPSVWPDFCPFVTLEAQALGTPVVLSDFPSQREMFAEDQSSAWFVTSDDVNGWANCLISVWQAKLRGELRAPTCRIPTIEDYARQLLQTYRCARRPLQL
jgi:glycosyltransferase involved in cell wall biosynthesis